MWSARFFSATGLHWVPCPVGVLFCPACLIRCRRRRLRWSTNRRLRAVCGSTLNITVMDIEPVVTAKQKIESSQCCYKICRYTRSKATDKGSSRLQFSQDFLWDRCQLWSLLFLITFAISINLKVKTCLGISQTRIGIATFGVPLRV